MISIDTLKQSVDVILERNNRSYRTQDQFSYAAQLSSRQWFMDLYGNPLDYRYGKPEPKMAYEKTQKISNDFNPFLISIPNIAVNSNGIAIMPQNMVHIAGLFIVAANGSLKKIKRITQDELSTTLNSLIFPPTQVDANTFLNPIYVEYNGYIQVYPITIANVQLNYLARPNRVYWAAKIVNNRPVYNSTRLSLGVVTATISTTVTAVTGVGTLFDINDVGQTITNWQLNALGTLVPVVRTITAFTSATSVTINAAFPIDLPIGSSFTLSPSLDLEWNDEMLNELTLTTVNNIAFGLKDFNTQQIAQQQMKAGV